MRDYIGSGHISAIAGLSPWSNPVKVYLQLTEPGHEPALNNAMKAGNFFEPGIANWWASENGKEIEKADLVKLPGKPYLGATPDYYIMENGKRAAILEVKNTNARNADKWNDDAPEHYIVQLIWQMHITGIHAGILCAAVGGQELKWIEVNYDREIGERLEQIATDFWLNHVEPRKMPPLEMLDAETLKMLYPGVKKGKEIAVNTPSAIFEEREKIKAQIKECEERLEELESAIMTALGDAEFAVTNDLRWKIKISTINKKEYVVKATSYKRKNITRIDEAERVKFAAFAAPIRIESEA